MGLFGKKKKDQRTHQTEGTRQGEDQEHIELREEELRAEKRRVEAGEVRVRKEVIEEQKTINVPVTREEVVVEKKAVRGRPADGEIGEEDEISIPVMEEQVRAQKTPVVKEEINVKKRQVQDTERVHDTVKREEAWVDSTGDADARINSAKGRWQGQERRRRTDKQYGGPDRRVASL